MNFSTPLKTDVLFFNPPRAGLQKMLTPSPLEQPFPTVVLKMTKPHDIVRALFDFNFLWFRTEFSCICWNIITRMPNQGESRMLNLLNSPHKYTV